MPCLMTKLSPVVAANNTAKATVGNRPGVATKLVLVRNDPASTADLLELFACWIYTS